MPSREHTDGSDDSAALSKAELLAALIEGRLGRAERDHLMAELARSRELRDWLGRAVLCLADQEACD